MLLETDTLLEEGYISEMSASESSFSAIYCLDFAVQFNQIANNKIIKNYFSSFSFIELRSIIKYAQIFTWLMDPFKIPDI